MPAFLTIVLIELAMRPFFPITLPRSSGCVSTLIIMALPSGLDVIFTSSGCSTSCETMYSTSFSNLVLLL